MQAFFPLFVFTGRNKEGRQGWREDQPLSEGFCPSMAAAAYWGSFTCARAHIQMEEHTWVSWCALISFGGKSEGWRVRQRETREGMESTEKRTPPTFPNSSRGSVLKAGLTLHGRTVQGVCVCVCVGGAGRPNLQSCWSAQGAPHCPAIHDNQSERQEKESEREGENMKKLSCSQRDKNKAPCDFHFFPLCLLYIVHRRVPPFSFLAMKGASKKTEAHTSM